MRDLLLILGFVLQPPAEYSIHGSVSSTERVKGDDPGTEHISVSILPTI